jgi:hypothetical protein
MRQEVDSKALEQNSETEIEEVIQGRFLSLPSGSGLTFHTEKFEGPTIKEMILVAEEALRVLREAQREDKRQRSSGGQGPGVGGRGIPSNTND